MTTSESSNIVPELDGSTIEVALSLGRELAANLNPLDTPGRWMAHHLAGLLVKADELAGDDRDRLNREIATLVVDLWSHRSQLPTARPIFERYDQIFTTLDRMNQRVVGMPTYERPVAPLPHNSDGWFDLRLRVLQEVAGRSAQLSRELLVELGARAQSDEATWNSYLDDFPDAHSSGISDLLLRHRILADDPDITGSAIASLRGLAEWAVAAADDLEASREWDGSAED